MTARLTDERLAEIRGDIGYLLREKDRELVYELLDEIDRLRSRDTAQITHWADTSGDVACFRDHHGCAIAEVERLRAEISNASALLVAGGMCDHGAEIPDTLLEQVTLSWSRGDATEKQLVETLVKLTEAMAELARVAEIRTDAEESIERLRAEAATHRAVVAHLYYSPDHKGPGFPFVYPNPKSVTHLVEMLTKAVHDGLAMERERDEARGRGASAHAADVVRALLNAGQPKIPDAHGAIEKAGRMVAAVVVELAEAKAEIAALRSPDPATRVAAGGRLVIGEDSFACAQHDALIAELRAEIAAFQGKPEGAIDGWGVVAIYESESRRDRWTRQLNGARLRVEVKGATVVACEIDRWDDVRGYVLDWMLPPGSWQEGVRDSMRAAEAEGKRRGWCP